jgi:hypothetical protein
VLVRALRSKLTFANVMVVILTFIVLGGGAYAMSSLPANSVGTKQLKNGAVTQKKISLAAQEVLRGARGPQGERGPEGPRGEQGPRGNGVAPGGTIPAGVTLRGAAVTSAGSASVGEASSGTGVSFGGFQLPSRPIANVVPAGGEPTTACPGSAEEPEAASGNLCVYITSALPAGSGQVLVTDPGRLSSDGLNYNVNTEANTTTGDGKVARYGFRLVWAAGTNTNVAQFRGSWAATG